MDRKFMATFLFSETIQFRTALVNTNFLTTAPSVPA